MTCVKCKQNKDDSHFKFFKGRWGTLHTYGICSECEKRKKEEDRASKKIYNKLYKEKYKAELKIKQQQYVKENFEKEKARKQKYRANNKEKVKEYKKKYNAENKEKISEYYREKNKQRTILLGLKPRIKRTKEEKLEAQRNRYWGNREKLRAKSKEYYHRKKQDPEYMARVKQRTIEYRKTEKYKLTQKNNINKRIKTNISRLIRHHLTKEGTKKHQKTVEYLGCSIKEFREYIEKQFLPGMNWENYGKGFDKWNLDHRTPCAAYNLLNHEEAKKCFHYSNMQPLWEKDNLKKSDLLPDGTHAYKGVIKKLKYPRMKVIFPAPPATITYPAGFCPQFAQK